MRKSLFLTISMLAALVIVAGCRNKPPRIPARPSGPTQLEPNDTAAYASFTTDPNRDRVLYAFDWGDGTAETTDFMKSGDTVTRSHAWSAAGLYPVKLMAKDEKGKWSADWSDALNVSVSAPEAPLPPSAPVFVTRYIPARGIAGGPAYRFYARSIDPNQNDSLCYRFYFDGTDSATSKYFSSGVDGYAEWTPTGDTHTYTITVRVFDGTGLTNDTMPTTTFKTVAEGEIIWSFEGEYVASPALGTVVWRGETWPAIVSGSLDEYLYVFDAYQGFLVNPVSVDDPSDYNSSVAVGTDGTRYVGNENGGFYAIGPNDTVKWRFGTGDRGMSATAALGNGGIYCGGEDRYIHKLIDNGPSVTEAWSYPLRFELTSSPAIGPDGKVYCCDDSGYVYCLNDDGTLSWEVLTTQELNRGIQSSPAIASDGTVYVGTELGYLLAIKDGSVAWSFGPDTLRPISSSPIIGPDGNIYYTCDDGRLYRVDQNSHQPVTGWPIPVSDSLLPVNSTPLLCADNTIYVADDDSLYAFDANNPSGGRRWAVELYIPPAKGSGHGPRRLSFDNQPSAMVDQYGIVYVATESGDGGIFAVAGRPGATLAASDWPMFHHDPRHTGRFGAR